MMKTGKIVKENQPRPLPNSGNKTSGVSSAISRRKLEYKEKLPLAGKKIYLNLKGVRQEKKVEEKLEKLGAIIEKFLSKEIHYFVTNQDLEKSKNDDQSPNGSPNMLISSPFNSAHTPSPSNLEKKTFTVTRGKAMLQCAKKDFAADNIVEKAKKLEVKVVPYLSLMKWLLKEQSRNNECVKAPPVKKAKVEDNQKSRKILSKARNLKQPFIKFEAVNKFFRPVQVELNSWPYLNMNSARGSCPFDDWLVGVNSAAAGPSKQQEATKQLKNKQIGCGSEGQGDVPNRLQKMKKKSISTKAVEPVQKTAQGRRLVNWERRKLAEKKLRQGFCECCEIRFDDVKKHLSSTEHSMFVKNETNYRQLDNLITNGYNVQQFISKVSDHHQFYPENSSNSQEYCSSSPGRIVLLTLSSSTSTHVVKASADRVVPPPEAKPACLITSSESETVTSQTNAPTITGTKTLAAKNLTDLPLVKNSTIYMKTPVKRNCRIPAQRRDGSPSAALNNNRRSPLKCILNSPSRIDFSTAEKQVGKPKGSGASFPVAAAMVVNPRSLFRPELQPHSKNCVLGAAGDQSENVKPAKCSPPSSRENFSVKPNKILESQLKSDGFRIQENGNVASAPSPHAPSVTTCSTPSQALPNNNGKNSISPLGNNSSGSKCANLSLKRNIRCSSGKSKNQRLFKLGEKWQVLSQQSVKKILFGDESPEPFTGFDPQDVFRHSDNSDVSYETISEVILTDPSEFEWILGNCEGKQVINGVHSDPSSQATFYNSKKSLPFREYVPADRGTSQEKSVSLENNFKKYIASCEDNDVSFCRDGDRGVHRECIEPNSTDEGNCIRGGVNSDSPKNDGGNVAVYLNSHKDFPPYIPNGQTSGYCSPSFQPNAIIEPSLVPDNQHFSATNDFETKVIQDLDYSQTPRYLHFESVDPLTPQCTFSLDNRTASYDHPFQQFQYPGSNPPINLDAQLPNTFGDYPRLFDAVTVEQSCGLALSQRSSFENSQEQGQPNHYILSDANTSIGYKENPPLVNDIGQCKQPILPQTPLPNLSYECSSLSVMSVDRTLNESDPNLHTPPDLPVGSSNSSSSNNNNNHNSFEAIPVLNFDSSFNFPVQNFPILSDFTPPGDNEGKRPSFGSHNVSKDPETPLSGCFLERENTAFADSIDADPTDKIDKGHHNRHERIGIDRMDLINCRNIGKYNDFNKNEMPYFNSYSTSVEDDKGAFSDTICTAETHSLISSLSQNAAVPLKTSEGNQQADLNGPQNSPSENNWSQNSPSPQKNPKPNFTPAQEPVLENEIILQLSLGCELQTSPPPHINPPSPCNLPEQGNEDLDMPPQLQLEGRQLPLPLGSPYRLSPPKLMLEVSLEQGPPLLPLDTADKEHCSLASSISVSSPLFCSLSPSLPDPVEPPLQNADKLTIQEDDSFLPLTKCASGLQDFPKFNLDVSKYLDDSCLTNPESMDKYHSSETSCALVNGSLHHRPLDTETNLVSVSYNSVSDQKPSRAMFSLLSSSSLTSSDPNVHIGNCHYKSDNEITDPLQKHPVQGMDTSDDAYAASEWNGLKNDSSAEIKDSGFFSVEELTPKKSPLSDSHRLSSNLKILPNIARPCSVLLEKTPDTVLVQSRFPLQKAVDQQNTFSVKRVNNAVPASPNSKSKPRLLKRLSDNQKTFRLDYIHGNCGGRKNLSRASAAKTRNSLRQTARFK